MAYSAQMQGALLRARNRRITRVILQGLTAWRSGLVVAAGDYVSSENGTSPWIAATSGTTGATAPTGEGVHSDGAVSWLRVDIQSLLRFKYSPPPTP